MKKALLLVGMLCLSLLVGVAWAQQRTVTGKVTSEENGESLPGVNVVLKGTSTGTVTDINGNYSVPVPNSEGVLVFSFIGLETKEVEIGNQSVINIRLKSDVRQLGEVVVTAFGIEREKKALSYAVQEVDGSRIQQAATPNTVNALQGKVAGVQIQPSSGMPGSSTFIRIRGSNSLSGNNQPLFVIDGIPVESNSSTLSGDVTLQDKVSGVDYSSRALDINPEDVKSISILKGPTAAALYGMRAANGVVIITTKSGSDINEGSARVNFSQSFMFDNVARLPDLQSTYAQGSNGNFSQTASTSWGPRISSMQPYTNIGGQEVQPKVYDNVTPMFRTGLTSTTNFDIAGNTTKSNYIFGIGYTDQTGIVQTTGMQKLNIKLSGEYKVTDKLKSSASISFMNNDINKLAGGSNLSNVLFTTYWAPRSFDLWGIPYAREDNPYWQIHYRGAMDNPRWALVNNSFNENVARTIGNASLVYEPFEWLSINYKIGGDIFTERRKEIYGLGSGDTGGRASGSNGPSGGSIFDAVYYSQQINSNLFALVKKDLTDQLNLNFIVGNEISEGSDNFQSVKGSGIQIGGFNNMNNTASQVAFQEQFRSRTVGFYGNLNLSFMDMLFLNVTGRNDIVSNMPRGNRTFFYPSVGLGFVFTELLNLSDNNIFNYGKLRTSYAEVGRPGPAYAVAVPFFKGSPGTGFTSDGIEFPFAGVTGFEKGITLYSEDLKPQNTKTYEIGLELQFIKNRLGLDINYYNENTTDQIFSVPIAPSTGYSYELKNAGEMESKGWEVTISGMPIKLVNGFTWTVNMNWTKINNSVIALAPGVENIYLGGFVTPQIRAQADASYPVIFGSRYLRDATGNIVLDSRQFINGNPNASYGMPIMDPVDGVIGNVTPDWEAGISNTFSYKGISLSAQVDIREGGQAYAGNTRLQKLYGMDKVTEDRNTPVVIQGTKGFLNDEGVIVTEGPNDIAILRGQQYWNVAMDAIDESNIYETSFVRLRELMLSYTLPKSLIPGRLFQNASVYLVGRNLKLWTKYPNFDPETSLGATNFQGMEYVNLPQSKTFGGGLRVTF